jgi:hypothetical protein
MEIKMIKRIYTEALADIGSIKKLIKEIEE